MERTEAVLRSRRRRGDNASRSGRESRYDFLSTKVEEFEPLTSRLIARTSYSWCYTRFGSGRLFVKLWWFLILVVSI